MNELGIKNVTIPKGLALIVDTENIMEPNENKVFQVALVVELEDDSEDVLTYLIKWDGNNNSIQPFSGLVWDNNGLNLKDIFPPVYRKDKKALTIIE